MPIQNTTRTKEKPFYVKGARFFTRDASFYKQLFTMMFFIAAQNLITAGVNLADNIMVGSLGDNAIAGVAMANQFQFILQMAIGGVGDGLVVLSSQYWGKKDIPSIKKIINIGLYTGLLMATLFFIAAFAYPEQILRLIAGSNPDSIAAVNAGVSYMRIISFTYFFFCINLVLISSMRSVQNVHIGFITSISALVFNIGLNYIFIFGFAPLGIPAMGVTGAAIATLIARIIETAIIIIYILTIEKKLKYKLQEFLAFSVTLFKDFIRVATPVIASGTSWGAAMFVQSIILGRLGKEVIAANSIASTLFQAVSVICYGAAASASVLTGITIGRKAFDKLREYVRTMQILFLAIGCISGLALYFSRGAILSLYNVTPETYAYAMEFLAVLSVTIVGTAYQVSCLTGIVRGGGHTKFVFYNDLIFMWGLVLPLSLLAAYVWNMSPLWVFIFLKSDQVLKCAVAAIEVNRYTWVRTLTREDSPDIKA